MKKETGNRRLTVRQALVIGGIFTFLAAQPLVSSIREAFNGRAREEYKIASYKKCLGSKKRTIAKEPKKEKLVKELEGLLMGYTISQKSREFRHNCR